MRIGSASIAGNGFAGDHNIQLRLADESRCSALDETSFSCLYGY